jgi:hypothetical protein
VAVSGDSHAIPSRPIHLRNGEIVSTCFSTNKPRELVEQDEERAAHRLLAGEHFEMACSGEQIYITQCIVDRLLAQSPQKK